MTQIAEPLTVLDAETIEELQPPCDGIDERGAEWVARFAFTCGHPTTFILCDAHAEFYRERVTPRGFRCTQVTNGCEEHGKLTLLEKL